jgi:ankyrin repeat protein
MASLYNAQMTAAAQNGNLVEMKRLYALGADITFPDVNDPLIQAACKGYVECMAWLLDNGAQIDRIDNGGKWTPLMCAAHYGHERAVRLLIDRGANRELKNSKGQTALACARDQKHPAVAQVLLNNPDEISFFHPVSDKTMQEVFNFPRRERITLIREGEGGKVEAMQRDSFSSLDDLTGLRKAFAEHKRMGGTLEESDVFSNVISKPKILRKEI